MEQRLFNNANILQWLQYFAEHTPIDLEKVKILDITRKNKNLIPTVEAHAAVLVFTEAGHPDIFYRMWDAGLGDCEVWYNEGSDPSGPILHKPLKDMINRGINASAGMLIFNPQARSTYKPGLRSAGPARSASQRVGQEIRAVLLNKMHLDISDTVCVIGAPGLAVEAAVLAPEGCVIAVEYNQNDRKGLEEDVGQFGLNNVTVVDHVDEKTLCDYPVPSLTCLVASASMEQEIEFLLKLNPHMEFIIYTLDFRCAAYLPTLFERYGIGEVEAVQIAVSRLNSKNHLVAEPAPWIISGQA